MNKDNYDNISDDNIENLLGLFSYISKEHPERLKKMIFKNNGVIFEGYNKSIDLLTDMHNDSKKYKKVKSKTKGDLLEEITTALFVNSKLYKEFSNIKSDSNEYDIILKPSELFKNIKEHIPEFLFQHILCECKNYTKKVDVTWIGKLFSLLTLSDVKIGVIISYEGITGYGKWDAAYGLIRKIYLKHNIAILNINIDHLIRIQNGENILDMLEEEYEKLKMMADLEIHKYKHKSEEDIKNILCDLRKDIKSLRT